jgi:hypothetical protein
MPPKRKAQSTTQAYVCMVSESESQYKDNVSTFAVVNSIEAARLACRDYAIKNKDEHFSFDATGYSDFCVENSSVEVEWWKSSFETGEYNKKDVKESRYRFRIWFEGPFQLQSSDDIPQHKFMELDSEEEDDSI